MAEILPPPNDDSTAADDEYIDMEISSFSSSFLFHHSINSTEFEFQMSSSSPSSSTLDRNHTTTASSPADELFYKGQLLPLHLPPRLQMFAKLLENNESRTDEFYSTPLVTTPPTAASTPYESCTISPVDSCRVSREFIHDDYLLEYAASANDNPKRSWAKTLKLIKQSTTLCSKLKASRSYLKALFGRSGCSDNSACAAAAAAAKVADEGTISKEANKQGFQKYGQPIKGPQIQSTASLPVNKQTANEDSSSRLHRRSFSMAIKRKPNTKSSSASSCSSSSSRSTGYRGLPFLKRSSSVVSSEIDNPIQGAIAHCKQSQDKLHAVNEVGVKDKELELSMQ
ncbi:Probable membrane-associated kinase regulator 4 [Linum grandiflorum]